MDLPVLRHPGKHVPSPPLECAPRVLRVKILIVCPHPFEPRQSTVQAIAQSCRRRQISHRKLQRPGSSKDPTAPLPAPEIPERDGHSRDPYERRRVPRWDPNSLWPVGQATPRPDFGLEHLAPVGSTVKRSASSPSCRRRPSLAEYPTTRRIPARTSGLLPMGRNGRAHPFICVHVVSGLPPSSSPDRVTTAGGNRPRGLPFTRPSARSHRVAVVPSNGRAPEVGRRCLTAIGDRRRLPRTSTCPTSSLSSRATCSPSRRLLVLALQEQLDALSDEGRGVPVLRVRDQLSHPVPRRLIHAEGDDSRLSCHSLSSFA
jgi:hypothetical protein